MSFGLEGGRELIHIYVRDGFVIGANGNVREGQPAIEQAVHLSDGCQTWLPGVQPPNGNKSMHLSIREITASQGAAAKPKMIETSRLATAPKKESETPFRYFLVPQKKLSERTYLTKTSTVLGRDPTADVMIDNTDVSWRHCLLDIQTRGVFIRDLDSTNGTFVNGILVRDGQVNPGDRIELGPYMFTLNAKRSACVEENPGPRRNAALPSFVNTL